MEYFNAFWVGGLICVIGQVLIDLTKLTPARIMVIFVTSGVILGAFDLYTPLVNFAGCGATVPLSGFGNVLANGVKESVLEDGFLGAFIGGVSSASVGISSAIFFGFLSSILSRPGEK